MEYEILKNEQLQGRKWYRSGSRVGVPIIRAADSLPEVLLEAPGYEGDCK